jgi:hypothetical protein
LHLPQNTPRQEQDVIGLFHELIGARILKGFRFFGALQSDGYDSSFMMDYDANDHVCFQADQERLGIDRSFPAGKTEPTILEFTFSFDGLVADFDREEKFVKHVDFVVCWNAGRDYRERFLLEPLLVGDEGSTRQIYGSTHKAYPDGLSLPAFEVLVLEDLMRWFQDSPAEEARQKQAYRER